MIIHQQPEEPTWLPNLQDVIVECANPIDVTITCNTVVLFEETMYPDIDNRIIISDLHTLLEHACRERVFIHASLASLINIQLRDNIGSTTETIIFHSIYADRPVEMDPMVFCTAHFLVRCDERIVQPGQHDVLHFVMPESLSGTKFRTRVHFNYMFEGVVNSGSQIIHETSNSGNWDIQQVDTSYNRIYGFIPSTAQLLYYKIETYPIGSEVIYHTIECYVDIASAQFKTEFVFRNFFGVDEIIYIPGVSNQKRQYEKSIANLSRQKRVYKTKCDKVSEITTVVMDDSLRDVMEDFFTSQFVWLLNTMTLERGDEVVIENITDETSNDTAALDTYKFSWEFAGWRSRTAYKFTLRIFTNEFNYIFS